MSYFSGLWNHRVRFVYNFDNIEAIRAAFSVQGTAVRTATFSFGGCFEVEGAGIGCVIRGRWGASLLAVEAFVAGVAAVEASAGAGLVARHSGF